jgi:hypothetical protein
MKKGKCRKKEFYYETSYRFKNKYYMATDFYDFTVSEPWEKKWGFPLNEECVSINIKFKMVDYDGDFIESSRFSSYLKKTQVRPLSNTVNFKTDESGNVNECKIDLYYDEELKKIPEKELEKIIIEALQRDIELVVAPYNFSEEEAGYISEPCVPLVKKVVFLDIDGVLQLGTQNRHNCDLDRLKSDLEELNPSYSLNDKYDLAAVLLDWNKECVRNLKNLLEQTGAFIVVSSDWRNHKSLLEVQLLFRLQGLDKYVIGKTTSIPFCPLGDTEKYPVLKSRAREIEHYLASCPEIDYFVIIDDNDGYGAKISEFFPDHFVYTDFHQGLTKEKMEEALEKMNNKGRYPWLI